MTEEKKVKLSEEDWTNLAPIKEVPLGTKKVTVKPLGFLKLTEIITKLQNTQKELLAVGVTLDNFNDPQNLLVIATHILQRIPEVIIFSCDLDEEDVKNLPINVAVILLETILDANIESQQGFIKNLTALASKATLLMGSQPRE